MTFEIFSQDINERREIALQYHTKELIEMKKEAMADFEDHIDIVITHVTRMTIRLMEFSLDRDVDKWVIE